VPSHRAILASASSLARTLANARDAPLCVPQRVAPRRTASCTRGSRSSPRKLSEPKLMTRRLLTRISRPGPISSTTRSLRWVLGNSSAKCSMNRISPFCRKTCANLCIGGLDMPNLLQEFRKTLEGREPNRRCVAQDERAIKPKSAFGSNGNWGRLVERLGGSRCGGTKGCEGAGLPVAEGKRVNWGERSSCQRGEGLRTAGFHAINCSRGAHGVPKYAGWTPPQRPILC